MKRADLILIGHGHVDHMSDAASVGARTGAVVVAAPVTAESLYTQPIPKSQVRVVTGRGGETMTFNGFTVEPILGRHGDPPEHVAKAFGAALRATTTPPTTEPLFQALKDDNPALVTVSRGYREPVCFDTNDNIQRRARNG